jgi:hypothetical protein
MKSFKVSMILLMYIRDFDYVIFVICYESLLAHFKTVLCKKASNFGTVNAVNPNAGL